MGLLNLVNIAFTSQKDTGIGVVRNGTLALLLQDSNDNVGDHVIKNANDIPAGLSAKNRKYIEMSLMGTGEHAPVAVFVFVEELVEAVTWDPKTSAAFAKLENGEYDYLVIPDISPSDASEVATWVKDVNAVKNYKIKVVLPNTAIDNDHGINFATEWVTLSDGVTYSTGEIIPRVASYIAATFPDRSIMYGDIPDAVKVAPLGKAELDGKAAAGELHLFNDGQKVRFASGVNALTTLGENQNESFRQIKVVEIMDMLHNSIKKALLEKFIGKYSNSLQNKLLVVTEIMELLREMEKRGLLEHGESDVWLDLDAQKAYLREKNYRTKDGRGVDEMNAEEIARGNTNDRVFIRMRVLVLGAIERIDIVVEV